MPRTDNDSCDLASSVGATATAVAASRAVASQGPDPLLDDPFAEPLVRAVGVDSFIKIVDGESVNELFYSGDRNSAREYLSGHGWQVSSQTTAEAFAANGFELPDDELISLTGDSGYLTATRRGA